MHLSPRSPDHHHHYHQWIANMRRMVIEDDGYDYDDCAMVAAMLHQLMNDDAQHDDDEG